ncbi:MAG: hypothetical protein O7F76_00875 [Planctomycetota bacterium]|nr:hypothetical protein [Planctomycetota bacterium]MCZ6815231.1 hypothetical protein [Planctomycetota bacterium]
MADFEISRPAGKCSLSGRGFNEGEAFYTVLVETASGFERRDVAEECWTGPPENAVCHFKARVPKKTERRKVFVDDEVLVEFFLRLGGTEEPLKQRFRFVLALMLMRKRLLKYEQTLRAEGAEVWRMRLTKDKSVHEVRNPELNEVQIQELSAELSTILAGPSASDAIDHASVSTVPDPPERTEGD